MTGDSEQLEYETTEPVTGEMLGSYEVRKFVARGGMASVMSATDVRSKQVVGIKLLLAVAHDDDARPVSERIPSIIATRPPQRTQSL